MPPYRMPGKLPWLHVGPPWAFRHQCRGRRLGARLSLVSLLAVLAAGPPAGAAQPPAKVARVGLLSTSSGPTPFIEALRQGLRDLGWAEGQNLVIEARWAGNRYERLPGLAAELARLKVDVIFASSAPSIKAAKDATKTIPIVFELHADPVAAGFVTSLARPGGNLTGLAGLGPELSGKRLELLKEVIPRMSRVAVLVNPANPITPDLLARTREAAATLGMQHLLFEVRLAQELENAFAAMVRAHADGLSVIPDPMLLANRHQLPALAAKSRLPAIYGFPGVVEAGGLMAYAPSLADMFRRAPTYVDKILKGAKPADLPVEQPTRFELVINMKTARVLGLTIPPPVLVRADQVIQ